MLRWLLPRDEEFFGLFEHHAALTVEGAKEMQRLVQGDPNIRTRAARIKEIEHETDVITHTCVERLHRTFITPFDRDDIHRLITRMDDVMAVAVSGLKNVKQSKPILDACIEVNRLENEGDEILRGALAELFRGAKDPLLVLKWKEVYEALENATDRCEDVANVIEGVVLEHA